MMRPSGNLTIEITNVSNVRKRWHDGPKPLETQLQKLMMGLLRGALEMKRQREEREQIEREQQEEERLRREAERRWKL
jgi:hypothetical protein